jgi:hypothetical protein
MITFRHSWFSQEVKYCALRSKNLFGIRQNCQSSGRNLLLCNGYKNYCSKYRGMLPTRNFFRIILLPRLTVCSCNCRICSVYFDAVDQLLTRYFCSHHVNEIIVRHSELLTLQENARFFAREVSYKQYFYWIRYTHERVRLLKIGICLNETYFNRLEPNGNCISQPS